eukprot:CAMPEP_0204601090 /NCGR_PEP_ID=MMETSP0661-20131031/55821_1 /ASSEMBLY_ACC=CAM_ASM_000606 /TAXON_ID=109239 /ORGANISM="Alexandrium margalefi, Strain AMGDE01CS-322" /LENGTH=306 /DNA_ID=CAMNT_0051611933 /DNA_START=41 /DNA_END=961 /DNA_ORIENTATION=-
MYVLIGPDNCNVVIAAPKMADAQDGWCSNFNCDQADDSIQAMKSRGVAGAIPPDQSLFKGAPKPPAWTMKKVSAPSLSDCSPLRRQLADKQCAGLMHGERGACIYDLCATSKAGAAASNVSVAALPYDCHRGAPSSWPAGQRHWCCKRVKVCAGTAGRAPVAGPCDKECSFQGHAASCKARIYWAATHQFVNQKGGCKKALDLVKRQCPSTCHMCELRVTACGANGTAKMSFFRKFEEPQVALADDEELPEPVELGALSWSWQAVSLGTSCLLLTAGTLIGRFRHPYSVSTHHLVPDTAEHLTPLE